MTAWKCTVCGYVYNGDNPPEECPQCSSSAGEFVPLEERQRLRHDGKKFDVLLINGSSHRSHNSDIVADLAEEALKRSNPSYRRFNLNELEIQHCWCCYSMQDAACTYPCRNQLDDMPALHQMVVDSRSVMVISPINWNNMSARLKDFLDRLNCIQNRVLLGKKSLTAGKVAAILVNGHEDGAVKTAMDIFVYFQQLGFVLAPFGFGYRTHGASYDAKDDYEFFKTDDKLKRDIKGVVNNLIEMMRQDLEGKIKDRSIAVCA